MSICHQCGNQKPSPYEEKLLKYNERFRITLRELCHSCFELCLFLAFVYVLVKVVLPHL